VYISWIGTSFRSKIAYIHANPYPKRCSAVMTDQIFVFSTLNLAL